MKRLLTLIITFSLFLILPYLSNATEINEKKSTQIYSVNEKNSKTQDFLFFRTERTLKAQKLISKKDHLLCYLPLPYTTKEENSPDGTELVVLYLKFIIMTQQYPEPKTVLVKFVEFSKQSFKKISNDFI